MSGLRVQNWSQRQQVVAVILMGSFVIFALWFFLLTPLNQRRKRLEEEIDGMRSQLARKNYLLGEAMLQKEKYAADQAHHRLHNEWAQVARRLAAFSNEDVVPADDVGHIDYKVALFNVRHRLLRKSREMNISLPHDLGMDDSVRSSEDARKLMFQLRTVEKLVDCFLDVKIDMLREIEPLPAVPLSTSKEEAPYMEEYPVKVRFYGSLANLYALARAVREPGHVFALRRFRVEPASRSKPDLLDITAHLSALVFLKMPDELSPLEAAQPKIRAPMGY